MTVAPTPIERRHAARRSLLLWLVVLVLAGAGVALLAQQGVFQSSTGSSPTQGSGTAATQTRRVPAFGDIELAGSNNVTVRLGDKRSVVVHGDDNLLRLVTTEVQDGALVIGNTGNFTTAAPMSVAVTVPALDALTLSGSGTMVAENVRSPQLDATISGSGSLRATGTADRLNVTLAGSGDAQLDGLAALEVRAAVQGSGRIVVHATNLLDALVSGTGAILYSGNPGTVATSVTGTGTIARG